MTPIRSLDYILDEKANRTWNCMKFDYNCYFKNFSFLKQSIDELAELTALGKIDIEKTVKIREVVQFLSYKIDENHLTYDVIEGDYIYGSLKKVTYAISEEESQKYEELKAQFQKTSDHFSEFMSVFSSNQCAFYERTEDKLIQKINVQFPYELGATSKLLVVVDREQVYTPPVTDWFIALVGANHIGCNSLYITDFSGRKWKTTGIPIGPRAIFKEIDSLEIVVKRVRKTGEIAIQPLLSPLPLQMRTIISAFIPSGRPNSSFVCHDFARLFQSNPEKLEFSTFENEKSLSPGDVICFTGRKQTESNINLREFVEKHKAHSAVYVGQKLYLSIYGPWGPLKISTLKAMLQFPGYKDIIVIRSPKLKIADLDHDYDHPANNPGLKTKIFNFQIPALDTFD